ncbi:UDP-glucuronosyl/UDP-glucosyltransferase [Streptomyces viridochromogenes]|uniref:UDP-glucuronosyl/UDP-glucosyltransferase n=1 Tax=Streptomyces viridochromogenes TaxID=1938 RepID=A0A0L8J9N2_STRVR|nr:UDP-glucuronosyl/UDP-glucosyltransferase [Streptomyces viridochromogenes]
MEPSPPRGRGPRVVVISPPFVSHAQPLSVLAGALARTGADVLFASGPDFEGFAQRADVAFVPLTVTRNANTGVARSTRQAVGERDRLDEFLDSTRRGAVSALLTQCRHRGLDMLPDPEGTLARIRVLDARLAPDWYLVDQLSYPVTLALHCLGLRYASFCPGHPTYVPASEEGLFGVPYAWPEAVRPTDDGLKELRQAARAVDAAFTRRFAEVARRHAPAVRPPGRAFALASPHAVLFNYPDFPWLPGRPENGTAFVYGGHCVPAHESGSGKEWEDVLRRLKETRRRVVLMALGTFLSARDDVLALLVQGLRSHVPDAAAIVAAGDRAAALSHLAGPDVHIDDSVPQRRLLGKVDAIVHHGGNNSFTEALASGTPALVLPFSSDQFSIAHDAERAGIARCVDPSRLDGRTAGSALRRLLDETPPGLRQWSHRVGQRGPDWMASRLMGVMS